MNIETDQTDSPIQLFAGFRAYAYRFAILWAIIGAIFTKDLIIKRELAGVSYTTGDLILLYAAGQAIFLVQAVIWAALFTVGQNLFNKQRSTDRGVAVFIASWVALAILEWFVS